MQAVSPVLPSNPTVKEVVLAKDQPEYIPLPVACINYADGATSRISRYKLSWRERLRVMWTGTIWWEQLTFGTPLQPQKMHLQEPFKGYKWEDK